MYKVVIVDDEAQFRKHMHHAIDWQAYGFVICGEAKNGVEALALIERERPDVAFIDINMPQMDGMDLATILKERFPALFILFVTGHSEFEYARAAVKIGVNDYILKPFDEEELLLSLAKVKGIIEKTRIEQDKTEQERKIWKESFLNLLISRECSTDNEQVTSQMNLFQLREGSMRFQVVSVEMDAMQEPWPDSGETRLRQHIIGNLLNDLIRFDGTPFTFNGPENRVVTLLHYADAEGDKKLSLSGFHKLCAMIKRHFGFTVTVGIGSAGDGVESIRKSYKQSIIALRSKLSMQLSDVIVYQDIQTRSENIGFYPSEINENLLVHLRLHQEEEIKANLDAVRTYIKRNQLSGDNVRIILAGLLSLCLTYVYEIGKRADDVLPEGMAAYHTMIEHASLDAAFEWIHKLFQNVVRHSKDAIRSKSGRTLELATAYIAENYRDSQLKVEDIAKQLYIQPRYLLRLFQQAFGKSVSEYILDLRMQKAKELLVSGRNLRLTDVAEMVGYGDPGHFSKTFKKYTGLSPSEYEIVYEK